MKERHQRKVAAKHCFQTGDVVYRRNCRKLQRKQSKLKELNWIGPYTVKIVSSKGVATLVDKCGSVMKLNCSVANLKLKRKRPSHLMEVRTEKVPQKEGNPKENKSPIPETVPVPENEEDLAVPVSEEEQEPSAPVSKEEQDKRATTPVDLLREQSSLSEIVASITHRNLPKITSPSQVALCHGDPRLSLIAAAHNESEDLFGHVFGLIQNKVTVDDLQFKVSVTMLATAVIVWMFLRGLELHEAMGSICEIPSHLEKASIMPFPKMPATKKLVIGSNSIMAKDLKCLDGQACLDDTIVHAYLGLLQREKSLQQKNEVFVLPCFLMEKWNKRDFLAWLYPNVKFGSYAFVMMPVCIRNHWLLLVANVQRKTIAVFDSLGHQHREIENKWRKYMFTREKYVPEGLEKWQSTSPEVNLQKDGNSCGVFVLMYAEAILSNSNPLILHQGHVARYRRYIKQRLLEQAGEGEEGVCQIPFCKRPKTGVWSLCQDCGMWVHLQCSNINKRKAPKQDHVCVLCVWRRESKLSQQF